MSLFGIGKRFYRPYKSLGVRGSRSRLNRHINAFRFGNSPRLTRRWSRLARVITNRKLLYRS